MINQDHHYVPIFYLRQWADGEDKKVPYFRWVHGKVVQGRISPDYTGYETNLYAKENVAAQERHIVEEKVFSPIDSAAAPIHQRLMRREKFTFSYGDRMAWAAFLIASTIRVPDVVERTKLMGTEVLKAELAKTPEEFEKVRGSAPELTLTEWVEKRFPDLIPNYGLDVMVNYIFNEDRLKEIMDMDWSVHSNPTSSVEFVTSDRPLWSFGEPKNWYFSLVLPLSPRSVFVASRTREFSENLQKEGEAGFTRKANRSIISRAAERAYGRSNIAFVERCFRETPGRVAQPKDHAGARHVGAARQLLDRADQLVAVPRLVGDQLQQHELQLARVEDAPAPAAAVLAVAAEAVTTAMAEVTPTRAAVIAGEFQRLGLVRSGMSGPPAEASMVMAIVAAPMAPALVVAVGGVGKSHFCQSFMF